MQTNSSLHTTPVRSIRTSAQPNVSLPDLSYICSPRTVGLNILIALGREQNDIKRIMRESFDVQIQGQALDKEIKSAQARFSIRAMIYTPIMCVLESLFMLDNTEEAARLLLFFLEHGGKSDAIQDLLRNKKVCPHDFTQLRLIEVILKINTLKSKVGFPTSKISTEPPKTGNLLTKADYSKLFYVACNYKKLDLAEGLLKLGADINVQQSENGSTPLLRACDLGNEDVARFLLTRGARTDIVDNSGCSPLHGAYFCDRASLIHLLLSHGADPTALNRFYQTPLAYTLSLRHPSRFICEALSVHSKDGYQPFQGIPTIQWINYLAANPQHLLTPSKSKSTCDVLQTLFLIGNLALARNVARMIPQPDYQRALIALQDMYPRHNLWLVTDALLEIRSDIIHNLDGDIPIPPVEPLILDDILVVFPDAIFFVSDKLSDISKDNIYFDEKGNLYSKEPLTCENKHQRLKAEELVPAPIRDIKVDNEGGVTFGAIKCPFLIMQVGKFQFPVKLCKQKGTNHVDITPSFLLPLFSLINFSRPSEPGYRNPRHNVDVGSQRVVENADATSDIIDPATLEKRLKRLVEFIQFRIPQTGTPKSTEPKKVEGWYADLERQHNHVVRCLLLEEKTARSERHADPTPSAPDVIAFSIAGGWCGTQFLQTCQSLYNMKFRTLPSLKDQILALIRKLKLGIASECCQVLFKTDVHYHNAILREFDTFAGAPQEYIITKYNCTDPIAPTVLPYKDDILEYFWLNFNPTRIVDIVEAAIHKHSDDINSDDVLQWFKENASEEWEKEKYDEILKEISSIPSDEGKAKFLKVQYDIVVNPIDLERSGKPNWKSIIEQNRNHAYIATNIQNQQTGRYYRTAVIAMLKKFGVFK